MTLATLEQFLAQTGRYHHDWDGGGWWVMGFLMLAFWAVAIALVVWLVIRRPETPSAPSGGRAREILAERYARGEISTDEYNERLDALR